MSRVFACTQTSHDAIRADLDSWLWLPIRHLQYIDASDGEPAWVAIHKQCSACDSTLGKLVVLTGEMAEVYTTMLRAQADGSVDLMYTCRRALDGCPLELKRWRAGMEMERLMGAVL